MGRLASLALVFTLGALALGCGGSVRAIVLDDEGGLLELEGDEAAAREAALTAMREHCTRGRTSGGEGEPYRVIFDGIASVRETGGRGPSAGESARRMALPSDLPGSIENQGTEPTGGSSVDDRGELHLADPNDGARDESVSFSRRRRIEFECTTEDGEVDEDGDGTIDP